MEIVSFKEPYRQDRNLGKAYNDEMRHLSDDQYCCITDYDVLKLLPDTNYHIIEYVKKYPECDMFVSWGSRTYPTNAQLWKQQNSIDPDITNHIKIAKEAYRNLYNVTEVKRSISGFLMVVSKRVWNEIPFTEDGKCLGVDSIFSLSMVEKGKKIYRMDGIYVWHTYRLATHIKDTTHLK